MNSPKNPTILILVTALFWASAHATLPPPGTAGAPNDPRYCGEPKRDASGRIIRSSTVTREFKRVFPCPLTLVDGACAGWQMNHTIPLVSGGCDSGINLSWMPVQIKTCIQPWCVDRWERKYHSIPRQPIIIP